MIGQLRRALALRRGIARLKQSPRGSHRIWRDLVYGWDEAWSAEPEFLEATAAAAEAAEGPILEYGSGLTTLVLAASSRGTRSSVWTLEHDPRCLSYVESTLRVSGYTRSCACHQFETTATSTGTTSSPPTCHRSHLSSATDLLLPRAEAESGSFRCSGRSSPRTA
jgi:hypothetical protein